MKNVSRLFLLLSFMLIVSNVGLAQDDAEELNELLAEYVNEDEPGVSVYIAYDGNAWQAVYGLANLDTEDTIVTDDLFRIASVTKPLVAAIILQLAEAGQLELDAPLANYLPDGIIGNIANADEATVRQMLQMTSGIYNYTESDAFDDASFDNPSYMWTAEEVLEFAYDEDAYFAVGEDYYYSNSNYILAQLIIENVTGNSLADELSERIFDPANMDSCYLETEARFAEGIVRGYQLDDDDDYVDITEINDGTGLGDGGVVCSAEDLAKFLPALVSGVYFGDDMLFAMFDTFNDGEGGEYGLGIGYDETDFGLQISHDGASSGFQSTMTYLPDENLVIVILTNNFDSEIIEDLTYDILDYLVSED